MKTKSISILLSCIANATLFAATPAYWGGAGLSLNVASNWFKDSALTEALGAVPDKTYDVNFTGSGNVTPTMTGAVNFLTMNVSGDTAYTFSSENGVARDFVIGLPNNDAAVTFTTPLLSNASSQTLTFDSAVKLSIKVSGNNNTVMSAASGDIVVNGALSVTRGGTAGSGMNAIYTAAAGREIFVNGTFTNSAMNRVTKVVKRGAGNMSFNGTAVGSVGNAANGPLWIDEGNLIFNRTDLGDTPANGGWWIGAVQITGANGSLSRLVIGKEEQISNVVDIQFAGAAAGKKYILTMNGVKETVASLKMGSASDNTIQMWDIDNVMGEGAASSKNSVLHFSATDSAAFTFVANSLTIEGWLYGENAIIFESEVYSAADLAKIDIDGYDAASFKLIDAGVISDYNANGVDLSSYNGKYMLYANPIPEPADLAVLLGLFGLGFVAYRRRK